MSKPFDEKVVLVTGSGRGIGKAIALHFAHEGADVIINFFRNRDPAEETADEIRELGQRAIVVKANVGDEDDIKSLINTAQEHFGGLDILINNAASGYNRSIMEQRVKGWDWTLNINARAALFLSQKAAPLMEARGGGAIVNISSIGSQFVMPEYTVVGVSKAALEALTRYLAVEFSPKNIVVNAVSAGVVETDALQHFREMSQMLDEYAAETSIPAQRNVTPEDVAGVVAFLCTPAAQMIRGQTLVIDGGFTLKI